MAPSQPNRWDVRKGNAQVVADIGIERFRLSEQEDTRPVLFTLDGQLVCNAMSCSALGSRLTDPDLQVDQLFTAALCYN